jgi:hypothetical protein
MLEIARPLFGCVFLILILILIVILIFGLLC